jgi:hypothetical protein
MSISYGNGIKLSPQVGDPATPSNGQIWYNAATGKFRGQQNGIIVDLITDAGGTLTNGDKGDITASDAGTAWTIDPDAEHGKIIAIQTQTFLP